MKLRRASNKWRNWSGSVQARPAAQHMPADEDELRDVLLSASAPVRVRGAGHSFTPVCATNGTLISLEEFSAPHAEVLVPEDGELRVRLNAGASLNSLSKALQGHGLAFHNLGDIDVQSLAGATATATHGTGRGFPCLSAELRRLRLMTVDGECVTVGPDHRPDILAAGQVSLGALGMVLQADVNVRRAYKLHRRSQVRPYKQVLADAPALWREHRNFEFFVIPGSDFVLTLTHDETDAPDLAEGVSDDHADLTKLRLLSKSLGWAPRMRRWLLNRILAGTADAQEIGTSWQLLASERHMRFHEMEYHLPEAVGLRALDEVRSLVQVTQPQVFFPIECRMTAADTAWLSPFQGGARISVAVHVHAKQAFAWFFDQLEPIFLRHGGRPHWGKLHSLGAAQLHALYPDFERFLQLRRELDPGGRLLNPHLAGLFGLPMPA